jgi:hypothetical protein
MKMSDTQVLFDINYPGNPFNPSIYALPHDALNHFAGIPHNNLPQLDTPNSPTILNQMANFFRPRTTARHELPPNANLHFL